MRLEGLHPAVQRQQVSSGTSRCHHGQGTAKLSVAPGSWTDSFALAGWCGEASQDAADVADEKRCIIGSYGLAMKMPCFGPESLRVPQVFLEVKIGCCIVSWQLPASSAFLQLQAGRAPDASKANRETRKCRISLFILLNPQTPDSTLTFETQIRHQSNASTPYWSGLT